MSGDVGEQKYSVTTVIKIEFKIFCESFGIFLRLVRVNTSVVVS